MSARNLDVLCARCGHDMAQQVYHALKQDAQRAENHITKSLGILQEDGVYAFFLYQASRSAGNEKAAATELSTLATQLLAQRELAMTGFVTMDDPLEAVRGTHTTPGLADNLDQLLLAKRLLEQALIYARYHAKALQGGKT
jgi:hypothetical protein